FVKSADKFGVELDHSQMSNGAKRQLPLWHHVGELSTKRQYNNKPTSQCLRTHHKVLSVGDALDFVQRLDDPQHFPRRTCMCDKCVYDREMSSCSNPHACLLEARLRLTQIDPAWLPCQPQGEPVPTLTSTDEND
ncbi:hypothetical protein K435DRAFT_615060, partial [Dendrothele bispora CBS 962.96]